MKVIEVLNFNKELLDRMRLAGIRLDDVKYVDMYGEFTAIVDAGEKVSYAVAILAEKYHISERKVYQLVKRFKADCKTPAVH